MNLILTPFSKINVKDFISIIKYTIQLNRDKIVVVKENPEIPTFENTILPLEYGGKLLSRITSIFFNLNSAETTPEIQKVAQKFLLY